MNLEYAVSLPLVRICILAAMVPLWMTSTICKGTAGFFVLHSPVKTVGKLFDGRIGKILYKKIYKTSFCVPKFTIFAAWKD